MRQARSVELVVISDVHLGTFGCRAKELLHYMKSINPECIILNGDIIDIWQFNKRYWPKSHMKVIKHLLKWIVEGKKIYYITGNHDEMLRRFKNFRVENFEIVNKIVLELKGGKAWFFHGDVFDVTMQYSKFLTKLGGVGYDTLILINSCINYLLLQLGYPRLSLSKTIKNSVKSAVKYINQFEKIAVEVAASNQYKYVVCGHIHQPNIEIYKYKGRKITYLNSGDWIENLSALEYKNGRWKIHYHNPEDYQLPENFNLEESKSTQELFADMLHEFNLMKN
ncbi:MAG: UDP-2,3-diacylglucosamine diphosphatase [Flavobacteriaceae bacterium]